MSSVTRTYFMLTVTDMPRAVAFYREVLGPVIRHESEAWTELKFGDATVALHASDIANPKITGLGVEVVDLYAAYQAVLATGGQILTGPLTDPSGVMSYEVADTEGNSFTLSGPPPATGAEPAVPTNPPDAPSAPLASPDAQPIDPT